MGPDVFLIWGPVLVCLGLLTGFLSGLLGVGGGIVLVPGLLFGLNALGFPPEHVIHGAIGTSLAIIVFTSMSSARAHHRHGAVRFDLIKK